jgi:hypothetical protein
MDRISIYFLKRINIKISVFKGAKTLDQKKKKKKVPKHLIRKSME